MRRRFKRLIFLFIIISIFLKLVKFIRPISNKRKIAVKSALKSVQLITWKFTNPHWTFKELGPEPFRNCPETRCFAYRSNSLLQSPDQNADAVVVHGPNLWSTPPKGYKRDPKQIWMFNTMEPQRLTLCSSHYKLTDLDNWFNLTATFKKDSDIVLDYKTFRNWSQVENESIYVDVYKARNQTSDLVKDTQNLSTKSRQASSIVWFVSHCQTNSKREDYVKELMKYVNVDVYGKCSKYFHQKEKLDPCYSNSDENCFQKFMNSYKFRLAFENSLCTDYITEKFWSMYNPEFIFDVNVVPIVRGAKENQYKKEVPFDMFYINADNYKSPRELADYLNYLNSNDTAYLEFFKWKLDLYGRIEENLKKNPKKPSTVLNIWSQGVTFMNKYPFCKLCEYLHNETYLNNHEQNRQLILSEWFNPIKNCWDTNDDEANFSLAKLLKIFGYCV